MKPRPDPDPVPVLGYLNLARSASPGQDCLNLEAAAAATAANYIIDWWSAALERS